MRLAKDSSSGHYPEKEKDNKTPGGSGGYMSKCPWIQQDGRDNSKVKQQLGILSSP